MKLKFDSQELLASRLLSKTSPEYLSNGYNLFDIIASNFG